MTSVWFCLLLCPVLSRPVLHTQIKAMGTREKSADVDFSGVLEQEVEDSLKAAAQISMGTEISEEDLSNIIALCDQVGSKVLHNSWVCRP